MQTIVKLQKKGQVVIPRSLRQQIGVNEGDLLEVKVQGNRFLLTPQMLLRRDLLTPPAKNRGARRKDFFRQLRESAPQALKDIWTESKHRGANKLTMRQINAIIAEVRREKAIKKN